jgi:hypothetical protein
MNDIGFIGFVELTGSILIPVLCRNASDVLTAPDADPTYTVLDKAGTTIQTGTLTTNLGGITGSQAALEVVTAARGYTAGETYTFIIEYAISAAAHGAEGMFSVY